MALRKYNQRDFDKFNDTSKDVLGEPKTDTLRSPVISGYKKGDLLSEGDLEGYFKQTGNKAKDYPQLSVQDYSEVKKDKKGNYVTRLKEGQYPKGLE